MKLLTLFLALLVAVHVSVAGEICTKTSPTHTIALLELYTSEGCDSCPPADRLVQHLQSLTGLSTDQVIPIALHVNYWDYIGWKDPYAQSWHTERQQTLAHQSRARGVYTPEFFLSGKELTNWRDDVVARVRRINQQPASASIQLSSAPMVDNLVQVQSSTDTQQAGELHLALIESGLISQVKAGENRGSTLSHDAVVRTWAAPIKLTPGVKRIDRVQLAVPAQANRKNLAVVAFIDNQQGDILQSLELPVCKTQN